MSFIAMKRPAGVVEVKVKRVRPSHSLGVVAVLYICVGGGKICRSFRAETLNNGRKVPHPMRFA